MPESEPATALSPLDRREGESEKAHRAFLVFVEMGEKRNLPDVADQLGLSRHSSLVRRWSAKWDWIERSRQADNARLSVAEAAADVERARTAALWEQRREQAIRDSYLLSQQLAEKVQVMLSLPLTRKVIKKDGKVTIIKPANWTMATLATLVKLTSDLALAACDEAIFGEIDRFDPATASVEEAKELLSRLHAKRKAVLEAGAAPAIGGRKSG